MTPDADLARFVAGLHTSDLPDDIAAAGRRYLLDALASAFAGHTTQDAPAAARVAESTFGSGAATVIDGTSLAPAGAAFLNGYKVTAATVCDVHRPTLTHVTPEVVPAALAAAEAIGAPGSELLTAVIAGMEIAVRVAEALDGEVHRARGWHNPGIAGVVGAAAAVARIHGLDETGVRHAFGHAASQAAGTFAALGTSGVKMHQARGAVSGLLAGQLAAAGFDAAPDALTAERGGLLAAYADGGNPDRLTDALGDRFRFTSIALRRWPAASSLQPVIAATLAAREKAAGAQVRAATVDLPARAFGLNATSGWSDQLSALQSARWIAAVAIRDGDVWVEQTAPGRLGDPAVAELAERVEVRRDDALALAGARITLRLADGSSIEHRVDVPPGDPSAPLTDADLRAKLRRALRGADDGSRADAIIAAVSDLEVAGSSRKLVALLARETSG